MMEIERPKIETASLSPDGRYGRFVAEPLERGNVFRPQQVGDKTEPTLG